MSSGSNKILTIETKNQITIIIMFLVNLQLILIKWMPSNVGSILCWRCRRVFSFVLQKQPFTYLHIFKCMIYSQTLKGQCRTYKDNIFKVSNNGISYKAFLLLAFNTVDILGLLHTSLNYIKELCYI